MLPRSPDASSEGGSDARPRIGPHRRAALARRAAAFLLVSGLFPADAAARQRAPAASIASDRPGFADGSRVIAPGVWHAEVGATLQRAAGDDGGVGSALLRWGLDPLELRFYLPPLLLSVPGAGTEFGDLGVGLKLPVRTGESWRWSVVAATTLPTGTEPVTAEDPTGLATLVAQTSLAPGVGFALNFGWSGRFDAASEGAFSLIATPSLALSDRTTGYAGYAGFFTEAGAPGHFIEAGVAGALGPDVQWDVNTGANLAANDWFLGVGLSRRWR